MRYVYLTFFLIISVLQDVQSQTQSENKASNDSIQEMPKFPGGEEQLFMFLAKETRYPSYEKEHCIGGTTYVAFVIDTIGKVTEAKVQKGISGAPALDKEALRVINKMPNWSVGKLNGNSVPVKFTIPVRFNPPCAKSSKRNY